LSFGLVEPERYLASVDKSLKQELRNRITSHEQKSYSNWKNRASWIWRGTWL